MDDGALTYSSMDLLRFQNCLQLSKEELKRNDLNCPVNMWCESNSSLCGFTIYFCLGDAMIACFGGGMGIYRWILFPAEREYALFIIHETRTHSTKRPISISPPCLFPTIGLYYASTASLWRGAPDSTLSASASERWQFVVCQAATRGM
jgi:hypothetical protein